MEGDALFQYLQTKGLRPFLVEGGDEAKCNCPYCGKAEHFYVALRKHEKNGRVRLPGFHVCMKCSDRKTTACGGLTALKRSLGDLPDIWVPGVKQNKIVSESLFLRGGEGRIRQPAVVPTAGSDVEYHAALVAAYEGKSVDSYAQAALAWLMEERRIPWNTLASFKIGFTWLNVGKQGKKRKYPFVAYPYYSLSGSLINFKFRLVAEGEFGFDKKTFIKWTGCESHPYGLERLQVDHPAVIIVEGEQDLLAYHAYGYDNVISLPDGANSWDHKWTRYVASYEQIYVALDGDDTGQDAAIALADRLGKLRCMNVLLPLKDANDCLMAGIPVAQIQKSFEASEAFPGGQIVEICDFEEQLVQRAKGGERTTGTSTGYTNLDFLLCGWREQELTILTGDTGMGKTTFLMTLCNKLASRVNTLYCPFEMKPIQLMTKLVAMRAKQQFMRMGEPSIRKAVREISDEVPLYFFDGYGQIGIDPIIEVVKYAARYLGIGAFVLDPLQYAMQHAGDPSNERKEIIDTMHKLQLLVKTLAIRIIMVVHPTKLPPERKVTRKVELDDLPGSASVKQDADNVLRIWAKPDASGAPTPHVELTVLKARSEFARCGTCYYWFDPDTLQYHEWDGYSDISDTTEKHPTTNTIAGYTNQEIFDDAAKSTATHPTRKRRSAKPTKQ